MKTIDIEIAATRYFNPRQNLVVPNVWWGLLYHEADLLVMTATGYAYEVEIKTCLSDLKRDKLKPHQHRSKIIKRLYFAIPEPLLAHVDEHVPAHAGIIAVRPCLSAWLYYAKLHRQPQDQECRKLTDAEKYQVARLGALRILGLKQQVRRWHRAATAERSHIDKE